MSNWWTKRSRPGHWFPPSNLEVLIVMLLLMGLFVGWQYFYWKDRPDKNDPVPAILDPDCNMVPGQVDPDCKPQPKR
jgi:hypothetical protein